MFPPPLATIKPMTLVARPVELKGLR